MGGAASTGTVTSSVEGKMDRSSSEDEIPCHNDQNTPPIDHFSVEGVPSFRVSDLSDTQGIRRRLGAFQAAHLGSKKSVISRVKQLDAISAHPMVPLQLTAEFSVGQYLEGFNGANLADEDDVRQYLGMLTDRQSQALQVLQVKRIRDKDRQEAEVHDKRKHNEEKQKLQALREGEQGGQALQAERKLEDGE